MVRGSRVLFSGNGGIGISATLFQILVCPLSKQPLRFCEKSNSLISDAIRVSFPTVEGVPGLVPKDGKIIETDDALMHNDSVELSKSKKDGRGESC